MKELLVLGLPALLAQNMAMTHFFGLYPLFNGSRNTKEVGKLSLGSLGVVFLATVLGYSLYHFVLFPLNLAYLHLLVFSWLASSLLVLFGSSKSQGQGIRAYFLLLGTNTAALGVALLGINREYSFAQMLSYSFFAALGYALLLYILAYLREQLEEAPVPRGLRGIPVGLFVLGIMAMALQGLV